MEPESSSPYPQVTAIRPYSEPTPSSPHDELCYTCSLQIRKRNKPTSKLIFVQNLTFSAEHVEQNSRRYPPGKGKGHPCTGTEALCRPYGP